MSSHRAILDPNPTRAQLRLVVLGQWVQAGLALVRDAAKGRGLVGGAVALWQVFQAVRLAIQLAQRLSEPCGLPSSGETAAEPQTLTQGASTSSDFRCDNAASLRQALSEIIGTIREVLGLGSDRRPQAAGADMAACAAAEPDAPRRLDRRPSAYPRPPDRPPKPERQRMRPRRPRAPGALRTILPLTVAPTAGRCRLGAG